MPDADHAPLDAAATLRALVQSGNASVVGTTTIDGVAAYELQVSGAPAATLDGTAYVAQSDYRPLLIQTTSGETISYSTYEYLPSSACPSPGTSPSPGNRSVTFAIHGLPTARPPWRAGRG